MTMRVVLFMLTAAVGSIGPWWLLLAAALLYAFRYTAYELLLLGFFLDVSYGIAPVPFIYTFAALGILLFMETLKPRLRTS